MPGLSNYLENELLDQIFRNSAAPAITSVWISLHSGDPGETGVFEISGNGYIRKTSGFDVASNGATANSNLVSFSGMPALTVTHVGLWDASGAGAGNFLGGGSFSASKTTNLNDVFQIAIGDLDVTLD